MSDLEGSSAAEIESKITDEHRAYIGRTADPQTFVIKEEDLARMRGVLQDTDPRWAPGTGIAPPYSSALPDPARTRVAPSILKSRLMTGHNWAFHRPFRVGEELRAIAQITDIRERLGGRYGYSVIVTTRVDFFDAQGNLVAEATALSTQFDPPGKPAEENTN